MSSPNLETDFALLVDPDADTANAAREALEESGLDLVAVKTFDDALQRVARRVPRLILSELALPDGSGFALCRSIRESESARDVPILLLSEWTLEADRILAFESGVDDFLAKPFYRRELASRIKAVLRRAEVPLSRPVSERPTPSSALEIDEERQEVRRSGSRVPLTPREFALIATLARHGGRVLSRTDLIAEAWRPGESPTERSVDAHVKSLRRKLGPARNAIETVRGLGYRYADSDAMASPGLVPR